MLIEMAHAPRKIHDSNWRDYIRFVNDAEMIAEHGLRFRTVEHQSRAQACPEEAEQIARAGLPPEQAEVNVASLKELLRKDGRGNPNNANAAMSSPF